MRASIYIIVLAGILSGCVPMNFDPTRDAFGVSTTRPDAGTAPPAAPALAALDTKAHAICTTGVEARTPTIQPAADGQQIVDQKLRCGHYDRVKLDFTQTDWSNVF